MEHKKKMIAPIVITAIFVLYYIGIAVLFAVVPEIPGFIKAVIIVFSLLITGVMIQTLISRIKEIQGGEEDDLSQY